MTWNDILPQLRADTTLQITYDQPNNPNNKIVHVRGVVDGLLVTKSWNRPKQRWDYQVETTYYYWLLWDGGYLEIKT